MCERYPGERFIARVARRRRQALRRVALMLPSSPRAPDRPLAGRQVVTATAPRAPPPLGSLPTLAIALGKETI
jgi:hypothetical protein